MYVSHLFLLLSFSNAGKSSLLTFLFIKS